MALRIVQLELDMPSGHLRFVETGTQQQVDPGLLAAMHRPLRNSAILQRAAIEKILIYLGLDPRPPPRGRGSEAGHTGHAFAAG